MSSPRVFVSYARSDGSALARELRRRLSEEHGFSLWQDLADMEGGRDWWRQITEAIDHVEYLVLVMTTAALRSPIVRDEWRYARQRGVCVIPVIGSPELDFSRLDGWMRRTHFVDPNVTEQWTRFVRTLEGPCQAPRVPLMAEPPPEDYVARPQELNALRSLLLAAAGGEPVAITAALRGAGGYGKTTLARVLCHEEEIQEVFSDGTLWVTLGEQPGDFGLKVEDLIVALTGRSSQLTSLEARKSRLAELLADRSLLLVVDDVWNPVHLEPFLVGGKRCARLITTRNADTLPRSAREVPVDAMQPDEAVELLRRGLPPGEDAAIAALARRLGEWPLLLKLVNGALRDRIDRAHDTLAGALAHAKRILDKRGLTAFDAHNAEQRGQAVAKTLGVSVDLLSNDEQTRLKDLAVFPEDVDVPIDTVEVLWQQTGGLDDAETEDLLQRLFGLSLLLGFDLTTRRIRLHDVIRAYLRGEIGAQLAQLDRGLVEGYRSRCPNGWTTGPHDGYFFQYLPWHLAGAGQQEELRALMLDCDWIEAKLRHTGVGQLLTDYDTLAPDRTVRTMGQALRLSAHVLGRDPSALLSQLLGRIDRETDQEIATALNDRAPPSLRPPWLRPRMASLTRPGGPLLQMLEGQTGLINAVALLADGMRAVSGASDGTVKVWDLKSGRELQTLKDDGGGSTAMAVTVDGRRAVSGAADGTLKVWDLESGAGLATLEGHADKVTAIAVTVDGARAVSGSEDRTLRVWNLNSGRALAILRGHKDKVTAVAVTADGTRAVSGSEDGTVKVWGLKNGRELPTFEAHTKNITAIAVTADRTRVVLGTGDGTLELWDLENGRPLAKLGGHKDKVTAAAITADGTQVVSGSRDRTLKVWGLKSGRNLATLEGHTDEVTALAVTADGRRVISASCDRTLKLWDLTTARELDARTAEGTAEIVIVADAPVTAVACAGDSLIVAGSADGAVHFLELRE